MKLLKTIKFLCRENHISFSKFCSDFLLNEDQIQSIENELSDNENEGNVLLHNIALYLGCSIDLLKGKIHECSHCHKVLGEVLSLYLYNSKYLCIDCLIEELRNKKVHCDACGETEYEDEFGVIQHELFIYRNRILCLDCILKLLERVHE